METRIRRAISVLAIVALASLMAARAFAAEQTLPWKQAFVVQLQDAVRAGDAAWLADHLQLPVRYNAKRKELIRTRSVFRKRYAKIMSAELRAAVLAQDPANVFENWQGMMIGDGGRNIWVRETGDDASPNFEIVTINDTN